MKNKRRDVRFCCHFWCLSDWPAYQYPDALPYLYSEHCLPVSKKDAAKKRRQMISQGPNTGIGLSAHIYSSKKRTQLWQLAWVIKLPFSFLGRLENCETLWQSLQGGANLVLPSGVLRGPRYITTFDNKVSFTHATHRNHQKGLSLAYQDMQIFKIYLWALF